MTSCLNCTHIFNHYANRAMNVELIIRTIRQDDNPALATIIRDTLKEFNANKPGTVYFDDSTDHLFEVFSAASKSIYYVATWNGEIMGGSGIYPTPDLPEGTCELVKLYLSPAARGKGIGKKLLERSIAVAKEMGYTKIYLETMPELTVAIPMYEKSGFTYLTAAQGNSGHTGCDVWMIKDL
jgi:putative acetyltransferase